MFQLTREQRDFLFRHKIARNQVFDAAGMRRKEYQEEMRKQDKLFAVGVTPCRRSNHTMRTRSGDCMQCNPAAIAFQTRHYSNAFVYIAASRKNALIKVGLSKSPKERETLLNERGYGGVRDWSTICHVQCRNAGRVEFDTHELLQDFESPQTYVREGKTIDCYEIFSCGYPRAREALAQVISIEEAHSLKERPDSEHNYNFPDIRGGSFIRGRRA